MRQNRNNIFIDKTKELCYTYSAAKSGNGISTFSSVGQSYRLITGWSGVRVPEGAPKSVSMKMLADFIFFVKAVLLCLCEQKNAASKLTAKISKKGIDFSEKKHII